MPRTSIYEPLYQRLAAEAEPHVRLTFVQIEEVLGRGLPVSAYKFSAWWSNESSLKVGNAQAKAWMNAGFRAYASIKSCTVEFRRA